MRGELDMRCGVCSRRACEGWGRWRSSSEGTVGPLAVLFLQSRVK